MNSYVFGSSGFIGKHLVKKLQKVGHKVLEVHQGDKYEIKKADYIFYLSSYGNHFHQTDDEKVFKANVYDYYRLLRNTINIDYKRLIYFSSSSVNLPIQTTYSDAKNLGEMISSFFYSKYNKQITVIRPFSVYGEGEADFRFIPSVIRCLRKNEVLPFSEGWHDWIYIQDFLSGMLAILETRTEGEIIDVGTGIRTSNSEIVKILEEISGKKLKIRKTRKKMRPYDNKKWVSNPEYLYMIDWEQKYSLRKGLEILWKKSVS